MTNVGTKTSRAAAMVLASMLAGTAEEAIELAMRDAKPEGREDTKALLGLVVSGLAMTGVDKRAAREAVRLGFIRSGARMGVDLSKVAASLV